MNVLCISASNTKQKGENSTSTKVCELIKDNINQDNNNVTTLSLLNYELKPCRLCGECSKNQSCLFDNNFNEIYREICDSNVIFLVVPHYSPIPSKLIMILEKINEILYASWIRNPEFENPIKKIRVGIIGHGGMAENNQVLKYYHDHLVTPIANTLRSLSFQVIGENNEFPNGSVFGLKDDQCIVQNVNEIFPEIIQDYEMIKDRVKPLINNVLKV